MSQHLKINGYDIVDFGSLNNVKDLLSIQDFIQKLLVAIYNISLDMLEEMIKTIKFLKIMIRLLKSQNIACLQIFLA